MSSSMGIRLGVEGEKEFKQSLRDINQSFKVLGSEMQLVTAQFDKNDKSMQAAAARKATLNKQIEQQNEKIKTLQAALENAASSFGENDKRTQAWQIQLNKAQAELIGLEKELDANEKTLAGVGDEMDTTAKASSGLGHEIENTGEIAEDAGGRFEGLKSVLAGVGAAVCAAMIAVSGAAMGAGTAMYNMATEAASAGNEVAQTALKMGMSRQAVQEWDYVLSQNGASLYNLNYGMRRIQGAMGDLREDGGKVGQAISRLGLNFDEVRRKSPEDAMNAIVTAFQGMEEGAEKTALALQIFGQRGGSQLIPMLNSTAEATDELRQRAHELGMVMSEDSIDAAQGFSNSMDTLQRTFGGVKNSIGAQLLPGMSSVVDGFTGLISGSADAGEQITAGVNEIINSIGTVLPRIVGIVSTIADTVAEIAPDILVALIDGITSELPALINAATRIIMSLLHGLIDALPILLEAAILVIVTLVQGISQALPELIPAIVQAVLTMVQALIDNLPMLLDAALELVLALADGILLALPVLIAALPAIIIGIVDFIIESIPMLIDAGIQLLASLVEALPEIIAAIVAALPQIIEGILGGILGAIPQLVAAGVQLLVALITNLPQIIAQVVRSVPQIISALVQGFAGGIGQIARVGGDLIRGLWQGIQNMQQWLVNKIRGLGQLVVGAVKSIFGIRSPSTIFRDEIGKNLAYGLGEGFEEAMKEVTRDMQKVLSTDFNFDVDTGVNSKFGSGADGGVLGAGGGLNLTLRIENFYNNTEQDLRQLADELSTIMAGDLRRKGVIKT